MPPPSPGARLHLLQSILAASFGWSADGARAGGARLSREDVASVSERCHGYTVADLRSLVNEAAMNAVRRAVAAAAAAAAEHAGDAARVARADLERALRTVVPSAMRSVRVELANTRFADVGGNEAVKTKIREAVLWKMSGGGRPGGEEEDEAAAMRARLQSFGITRPPSSLLLYGPPGCSKVRAAPPSARRFVRRASPSRASVAVRRC